jgi:tRNA 2-thiouridine synthesizing protein E
MPAKRKTTKTPKRAMPTTMYGLLHPAVALQEEPEFRDAPDDWTPDVARAFAAGANLTLTEDHWEVIRVLQGCYKDEVSPRLRLLRDALEARFASKGGMKYLYGILPGGPIAQGCGLAGLKPPHGAKDLSFGSVA